MKKERKKRTSKYYVLNSDLIPEIIKFKKTCKYNEDGKYIKCSGIMSQELGKMIWLISDGLSKKSNFYGYTWREDMVGSGILTVCKYLHNFNLDKSQNPFAYISQICNRAFLQYIAYSKKHGKIKQYLYDRKPRYYEDTDFYSTQAIDYAEIVAYENKEEETDEE